MATVQIPDRPVDRTLMVGAVVAYFGVFAVVHTALAQVPPSAGFHIDLGLVGLLSAIIGSVTTIIGVVIANRRRADPAVDHLLAMLDAEQRQRSELEAEVADLRSQIAAHHPKRRPHEAE